MEYFKMSFLSTERTCSISDRFVEFTIIIFLAVFLSGLGWTIFTAKSFAPIADFKCFYTAGKMIAEGKGYRLYVPQAQEEELLKVIPGRIKYYFNPPVFALPFVWLSYLPLMTAFWAWQGLSLIALFIGITLFLSLSNLAAPEKWLLGSFVLAFEPTYHNVHWGNISALVLLLLALFFRDLFAGKEWRAGVWLALLMVKPELFLISAFVVSFKRKWKFVQGYMGVGLILLLLSLTIVGVEGFERYFMLNLEAVKSFTPVQNEIHLRDMVSWRGLFVRLFGGTAMAEVLALTYPGLSFLLLVVVWRGKWAPTTVRFGFQWSFTLIISLLVAPHVHLQSLVLIFPALVLLFRNLSRSFYSRVRPYLPIGALAVVALSWLPELDPANGRTVIQLVLISGTLWLTWIFFKQESKGLT